MSSIVIENVSLDYPIYGAEKFNLRKQIVKTVTGGHIFAQNNLKYVRALNNINLTLKKGDRLGIIGHNGAGKSTLIRLIAGIYSPTAGKITVDGSVMPLLHTLIGMDLEKTGYENAIFMGMLLGMTKEEITAKIPGIVDFSELEDFMHLPVKTFSDGMMVRLGFSVCTSIIPKILVLDETIGAGDAKFLEKAQKRIKDFYNKSEILVMSSHSEAILKQFCNKFIILEKGHVVKSGGEEILINYSLRTDSN